LKDENQPDFVEAAIYEVEAGSAYQGEYVASCARNQCGYFGKLLGSPVRNAMLNGSKAFIERTYNKRGLHIKQYRRRGGSLMN
jgi:hypothetical protein